MSHPRPVAISVILTILILAVLAVLSVLLQMVALNGASEQQGITAMGISLGCQGVVILLAAIAARWLTHFLITKADWHPAMAVVSAVLVASMLGGALSFLSTILAIPIAGIG